MFDRNRIMDAQNLARVLEGFGLAVFTRVMGWTKEVEMFLVHASEGMKIEGFMLIFLCKLLRLSMN
jgi:hypothetical protein